MEEITIPMMSPSIAELTKALSMFQGSIKQPKLNKSVKVNQKEGGSYTFQYADLAACVSAATPELQKNGLAIIQTIQGQILVTTLSHTSGEFINSRMPLNQATLFSTSFQKIGSMITYLKRYAYCAILGIVADDDDDANAACGNQVEYNDPKQATKQQPAGNVTGAQLKKLITEVNASQSIDETMAIWRNAVNEHAELQKNQTFISALFQKASNFGIEELGKCNTTDDVDLLIERWNGIWANVIAENTPFGNAINAKLKELNAA